MNLAQRPSDEECFDYHRDYVAKVPDGDILETLSKQSPEVDQFIRNIDFDQWEVVHEPYGWKVRIVIEHCCDAERVFGYRILRFGTGDKTDLPGWDEQHYAACEYSNSPTPKALAEEFSSIRQGNLRLLERLKPECWDQLGTADGRGVSVRTAAWLMAGHWIHHEAILKQRLGLD